MTQSTREHDIVVYGATGFAGALVARHLAAHAPAGARLALAGRSATKLTSTRAELGVDWPIVVADAAALMTDGAAQAALIDAHPMAEDPYERQIHLVALQRAIKQTL